MSAFCYASAMLLLYFCHACAMLLQCLYHASAMLAPGFACHLFENGVKLFCIRNKKGWECMRTFNTTGLCVPEDDYMVDITDRLKIMKQMVDEGQYFTMNRGRQYGKTTTLFALSKYLKDEYQVLSLDFQGIGNAGFQSEEAFVQAFSRMLLRKRREIEISEDICEQLNDFVKRTENKAALDELFFTLSDWCESSEKPIVMFIDEVDSATNNQVFLDFLAGLREGYINRDTKDMPAFQSVILAGVTDVKHLKSKISPEDGSKENSPWNIAADFTIDMSLSEDGIKGMLEEYDGDHHIGMDTEKLARQIREYTNGYPFLVSRICQLIDEKLSKSIDEYDDNFHSNEFVNVPSFIICEFPGFVR